LSDFMAATHRGTKKSRAKRDITSGHTNAVCEKKRKKKGVGKRTRGHCPAREVFPEEIFPVLGKEAGGVEKESGRNRIPRALLRF